MVEPNEHRASDGTEIGVGREPFVDKVFIGPKGLRAGWRIAIYIAASFFLTIAIGFVLSPLFGRIPDNRMHEPYLLLIGDCIGVISAIVPALFLARLEGRRFADFGLPVARAFGRDFWVGAAWGIVSLTTLLVIMRLADVVSVGGITLHGARTIKFAAFWGLTFLMVGLYEEFFTRGYMQFTLTQGIGFWPAAFALSAVFGAAHILNPGENLRGALGAGVIGLFWCLTLRRTGTLWFGVGMHAAWDWAETFVYGVPDSGIVGPGHLLSSTFHGKDWLTGGSVGPEASVLLLVVMAMLWILFDRIYPNAKYDPS